jgi:hypothetical protein
MRAGVPVRTTAVWIGLMAATCLTLWLGNSHSAIVAVAIPVAFLKVYFIGSEFMELHGAPIALRAVFTAWVIGVSATTTVLYLL